MPKLRVGVFMGGKSIEREVSFNSGRTICDHLDTARYEVIPVYQIAQGALYILPWKFLHRGKTTDFEYRLATEAEHIMWDSLSSRIDFMYIAMHGRYAEDGILQGTFELLGIPYLGSSRLASALCMDKTKVKKMLAYHGIRVPKDIVIYPDEIQHNHITSKELLLRLKKKKIPSPWIVKPHNEGSSIGISVVHSPTDLIPAIKKAATVYPQKPQAVIVEEQLTGMEFSCITLFDYRNQTYLPLIPTEIVPDQGTEFFNYEQKYMPGCATKFTPPRCSPEIIQKIQQTCIDIMQFLDIKTLSRIDGFITKEHEIIIVDPNTSSGMAPSSFVFREAAELGISHPELINHIIETDLDRYHLLEKMEKEEKTKRAPSMKKKLRVGVLMGGASHEKEISLESGRNITYKLSPHSYAVTPLFADQQMKLYAISQSQLVKNSTAEITASLKPKQQITWHSLKQNFDFIFIGLHGGAGENGSVQGMLEMLDIPYNGSSVFASALCMDKYKTAQFLNASGFDVPQQLLISDKEWHQNQKAIIATIKQSIPAPYIIKPHNDGCSVMVYKADTNKELIKYISILFKHGKTAVLIEQFLHGIELTVGVIGNHHPQAFPPSHAIAQAGILSIQEKFLPGAGENQTPAQLPPKQITFIQKTVEKMYKVIGCHGYARIDCFYQSAQEGSTGKERLVTIEINTLPGLTPATCIFHQAAEIGLKPMEFIDQIVQLGLEAHHNISQIPLTHSKPKQFSITK